MHGRNKDDKDANLSDDDEYLEAHPERRPIVVIDNSLRKSQDDSIVYDKIPEYAAGLTTSNSAHVIFLTTDVSFSKSLSKALPDRVFLQISLDSQTVCRHPPGRRCGRRYTERESAPAISDSQ